MSPILAAYILTPFFYGSIRPSNPTIYEQDWETIALNSRLIESATWNKTSERIWAQIESAKQMSKSIRRTWLFKIVENSKKYYDSNENGILYIRLLNTFPAELREIDYAFRLYTAARNSRGFPSISYNLERYKFHRKAGGFKKSNSLGLALLHWFPADQELKREFILDCAKGYANYQSRVIGRNILHRSKTQYSDEDFLYYDILIGYTLTTIGKNSTYVKSTRAGALSYLNQGTDKERRQFISLILERLNSLYPTTEND